MSQKFLIFPTVHRRFRDSCYTVSVSLTWSVSPLNPSDSEKLESRPLSIDDLLWPTTIRLIEGAFCTLELMVRARPSEDTTRLTTRPLPVDGATGGLGACLFEDGLKAEVETGLLKDRKQF